MAVEPRPTSVPVASPEPEPKPVTVPEPAAEPTAVPEPQPEPAPEPEPTAEPEPVAEPKPNGSHESMPDMAMEGLESELAELPRQSDMVPEEHMISPQQPLPVPITDETSIPPMSHMPVNLEDKSSEDYGTDEEQVFAFFKLMEFSKS